MITVEGQRQSCGCRTPGECEHGNWVEERALDALVDAFAAEMKLKLRRKYWREGYTGWDDRSSRSLIEERLGEHVGRLLRGGEAQEVDVANLAAMLWNFRQG
jgi:hypothetical protein